MIPIKKLVKQLKMRDSRVLKKIQKLGLPIRDEEGMLSITRFEVVNLLESYISSKRTNEQTKLEVQALLDYYQNDHSNIKKMDIKIPERARRKKGSSRNSTKPWKLLQKLISGLELLIKTVLHKLVQSLESLYFKFIALFVSICVQMHHTAIWYYHSVPDDSASWLAAIGFAIMLDLFVLVLTLENRLSIARTFAWLTFVSNILYFRFWVGFNGTVEAYTNAVSSIIISAIIAFILYSYTEIFVKYQQQKEA